MSASQVERERRAAELRARHKSAVERVNGLLERQAGVSRALAAGLGDLEVGSATVQRVNTEETGLFAAIARPFTARRTALARKSAAEELFRQYEHVAARLRDAAAFTDELRLCALELHREVEGLYAEAAAQQGREEAIAARVAALEGELVAAEAAPGPDRAARLDQLGFALRQLGTDLALARASAKQAALHVGPARDLRDTVQRLHAEMAEYVVTASAAVNAAGRRVQALGALADAPLVIAELHASIRELEAALDATGAYVEKSQELIARVLPDLAAQLTASAEIEAFTLPDPEREAARREVDAAQRAAAQSEVDGFLAGEGHKRL